jgi:hypothetical protein
VGDLLESGEGFGGERGEEDDGEEVADGVCGE